MSRARKQIYRSSELQALTRQLLYAPAEKRAEVVRQAEQFHDQLDITKNYPIDFIVYRLTNRRVPPSDSVMLVGEAIKPDLRLLIDVVSRSIEMPDVPSDRGKTTAELAQILGVSTKTIGRWRNSGLRWRWGIRDGKPTVLILDSAVRAFDQAHTERIAAAASFQRISAEEKSRLIERARRIARATDELPQAILNHLAKRTGRSVEALRQLVHRHDKEVSDDPIFVDRAGPLSDQQKSAIDQAYQQGVTVSVLCKKFGKTRSTIYRAIHEARARRARGMTIDLIHSPIFEREDADEVLMRTITRQGAPRQLSPEVIGAVPDQIRSFYDRAIEPDDVVRSLAVRYNYLKYRAHQLRQRIASSPPRAAELTEFDHLLVRVAEARGEVISCLLPVTLSVVRRQQPDSQRADNASLLGMLLIAHRVLIEAIERYDASVSHSLESVLTNRLLKELAKSSRGSLSVTESDLINQLEEAGFRLR